MSLYAITRSQRINWFRIIYLSFNISLKYNYVNPICCVATVCHQVRCMYWGHLGHFHMAISHLKWYKIACMRYLACAFSQMKYINMFSMFLQSGVPRHFLWRFIAVWIYNLTIFMSMLTSNSSGNMQKLGYLGCFHAASARKIHLGFG